MLAAAENNWVSDQNPQEYLPRLIDDLGDEADAVFGSNLLPRPSDYDYGETRLQSLLDARGPLVKGEIERLCSGFY
jgi:hypothetical protein